MQGIVPPERRYLEVLHAELNLGNAALTGLGKAVYYLSHGMAGTARDRTAFPPTQWEEAHPQGPPPRYNKEPLQHPDPGLELEDLLTATFGAGLRKPMQGFHGTQLKTVLCDEGVRKLFSHPLMLNLMADLDDVGKQVLNKYYDYFSALAVLRRLMNSVQWNEVVVERNIEKFEHALEFLSSDAVPLPCRMKWRLYEHSIVHHLLPQMKALRNIGLTLAQMSSRSLEAHNKVVKGYWRRLLGGGKPQAKKTHMPIVQAFNRAYAKDRAARLDECTKRAKEDGVVK